MGKKDQHKRPRTEYQNRGFQTSKPNGGSSMMTNGGHRSIASSSSGSSATASSLAGAGGGAGGGHVKHQHQHHQQQQQQQRIERRHVEARKALPIYKQRGEIVEVSMCVCIQIIISSSIFILIILHPFLSHSLPPHRWSRNTLASSQQVRQEVVKVRKYHNFSWKEVCAKTPPPQQPHLLHLVQKKRVLLVIIRGRKINLIYHVELLRVHNHVVQLP